MPTWTSLAAFNADVVKAARDIEREVARRTTRDMAEKAQQIARAEASADLGGDPKFSGWAPPLDTQIKRGRDGASSLLMPTRSSAGPWTVAEFGRNSAFGPAQLPSGRSQRVLRSGRLSTARGTRKRYNGRTAGKGTASRASARMERELPEIAERAVRRSLAQRFTVR
jgi:hypothetical protein